MLPCLPGIPKNLLQQFRRCRVQHLHPRPHPSPAPSEHLPSAEIIWSFGWVFFFPKKKSSFFTRQSCEVRSAAPRLRDVKDATATGMAGSHESAGFPQRTRVGGQKGRKWGKKGSWGCSVASRLLPPLRFTGWVLPRSSRAVDLSAQSSVPLGDAAAPGCCARPGLVRDRGCCARQDFIRAHRHDNIPGSRGSLCRCSGGSSGKRRGRGGRFAERRRAQTLSSHEWLQDTAGPHPALAARQNSAPRAPPGRIEM